jgi:acyl dehydratase
MALDLGLVGKAFEPQPFTYTSRDVALYALGIGANRDELDYLYEGRGPKVFPSFAVVPMFKPMFEALAKTGADLSMVVHGGQSIKLHAPFPSDATVQSTAKIRGIYDMRKFAVVHIETETRATSGTLLSETLASIICRGEGGFEGAPVPKEEIPKIPKEVAPDFREEEKTSPEQALLYRLSGDINPLHADPAFAASVGFPQGPILHGLCTYGFLLRHVAKHMCAGDAQRITGFEAQFRRPVWPGDTLVTEGFKVSEDTYALRLSVKERDEVVLAGAWARSRAVLP